MFWKQSAWQTSEFTRILETGSSYLYVWTYIYAELKLTSDDNRREEAGNSTFRGTFMTLREWDNFNCLEIQHYNQKEREKNPDLI